MKNPRILYALVFMTFLMIGEAFGQWYSSYTSRSINENGTVTQIVVLEGSTQMNIQCTYQCGRDQWCTIPNCPNVHQPRIYNHIGTAGGWSYGNWYTPSEYISFQTTAQYTPIGGNPTLASDGEYVYCTAAAGNVFSRSGNIYIRGATTLLKMTNGTERNCFRALSITWCDYDAISWCTPETSPPLYNPSGVRAYQQSTPNPAYYFVAHALCESSQENGPYTCLGASLTGFQGSNDFPKLVCTK